MKCKRCGFELKEGDRFCEQCGAKLEAIAVEDEGKMDVCPLEENVLERCTFSKKKMIGSQVYKKTTTEISILEFELEMIQTRQRPFRKKQIIEKKIMISSITSIRIHTVLDFWDTLYTIIFAILGLVHPSSFLMAAVCFWCAYGKELQLTLSNGEKIKIPFAHSTENVNKILARCTPNTVI